MNLSSFWNQPKGRNTWRKDWIFRPMIHLLVNNFVLIYLHCDQWAVGTWPFLDQHRGRSPWWRACTEVKWKDIENVIWLTKTNNSSFKSFHLLSNAAWSCKKSGRVWSHCADTTIWAQCISHIVVSQSFQNLSNLLNKVAIYEGEFCVKVLECIIYVYTTVHHCSSLYSTQKRVLRNIIVLLGI